METNRWITGSQHLYGLLLRLYPQVHRANYAMEMLHVFTDQCREAYQARGAWGLLALWPRTLVDLGLTAASEHIHDPQARIGLLESRPNAPLPWKGVLLVLVPGLVFFVSQVIQLTSTEDWYFITYYRAAYFLILPVLLVWLLTRRFPVWGLLPVGLLYETLWTYGKSFSFDLAPSFLRHLVASELVIWFDHQPYKLDTKYLLAVVVCALLVCLLLGYHLRRRQMPRAAWLWLGLYGLLTGAQLAMVAYSYFSWQNVDWAVALQSMETRQYLLQSFLWYLYESLPFLVLVLIGGLFARKHGGLSLLVLLGYILPTIIFGRYGTWNDILPFTLVSFAVLFYRFIVALLAPVWLVRSASAGGRRRALTIPVLLATASQIALSSLVYLTFVSQYGQIMGPVDFAGLAFNTWNTLLLLAGLGLAFNLYLPGVQTPPATSELPPTALAAAK